MLRFIVVSSLTAFALASQVCAQQMEDVVHLKNGGIVRGMIIEQIPNESLKVQTQDGSLCVYTMDEIARMAKEPEMGTDEQVPARKDAPATGVEIGTLFGITRSENLTTPSKVWQEELYDEQGLPK